MDDEYEPDEDLLAALVASSNVAPMRSAPDEQRLPTSIPQRPQPLAAQPAPGTTVAGGQTALPPTAAAPKSAATSSSSSSSILVSPRQRGNPVLTCLRTQSWEYSDSPADYVLGVTTCALFLSIKYHRLHPEYVYTRIRGLQGKYSLRVLLTMVDVPTHEDALRELSKTSLVNGLTLVLCWSAAEAARYLELYKSYEHAGFGAIKGQQTSTYGERLVDFVTVPRSINKADTVALVSNFGSLRRAINADAESISMVGGWGEAKVKRWCSAVQDPFKSRRAVGQLAAVASQPGGTEGGTGISRPPPRGEGPVAPTTRSESEKIAPIVDAEDRQAGHHQTGSGDGGGSLAPGIAAALSRLRREEA